MKQIIIVQASISAPVEKVWKLYTDPKHIIKWNNASDDWHTPKAENDLRVSGKFLSRMESKDGKQGFDFKGVYSVVEKYKKIEYTMSDKREVKIIFSTLNNTTNIKISFEAENTHPIKMQKEGWQAILSNFKQYVEETK